MCEESMRTRFTAVEEGKGPGNEGTDFEDCSARLILVEEDGRRVKAAARARRPTPPPRPSEQVTRTEPPCESGKPGVPEHPRAGFELVIQGNVYHAGRLACARDEENTRSSFRRRGGARGVGRPPRIGRDRQTLGLRCESRRQPSLPRRRPPLTTPVHSPPPPSPAPIHRDCVLRPLQPRHRRSQGVQLQDVPERAKVLARGEPSALRRHGRFGAR